jgi:pimeloyl-ACP methyl ester carboxylesterase
MRPLILQANGLRFEALADGPANGLPVLLLHGFPESAQAWHQVAPALAAAGWQVLAPNQRGYGGSDKPPGVDAYRLDLLAGDALGLADAMGWQSFSVVGHDWGGVVAWHLATLAPQRLRRLVVLNAPHAGTLGPYARRHPVQWLRSWYMGAFQLPVLPETLLRAHGCALLRRSLVATSRRGTFTPGQLDRWALDWQRPGALTAMLAWYRALPRQQPTPRTPIGVPTTVVWGERDRFLDRGLADAALALCRDGRLQTLPRCTHWLHHEAPDEVAALLLRALD